MENMKKYIAEFIGTAVLVIFGCGVAVATGVDTVATSLAFGLVIVAMAYSIGNVSGCHINPAVSIAMLIKKKISVKEFIGYVVSQVLGALFGALLLGLVLNMLDIPGMGFETVGANQLQAIYGEIEFVDYIGAMIVEIVLTFVFVLAILGVTSKKNNAAVAGLVIGGALVLAHLLGLGFTGTSVNPARSIGPAIVQAIGGEAEALKQVWVFILAPLAGGALAALVHNAIDKDEE